MSPCHLLIRCPQRSETIQGFIHTSGTVMVQLMAHCWMPLCPKKTCHNIGVGRDTSPQISWLHAAFPCCFATFSVDGREVQLIVGFLIMLVRQISQLPQEHITWGMQDFHCVMHCLCHIMEYATTSRNGLKVIEGE